MSRMSKQHVWYEPPKTVRIGHKASSTIILNNGALRRCILSPLPVLLTVPWNSALAASACRWVQWGVGRTVRRQGVAANERADWRSRSYGGAIWRWKLISWKCTALQMIQRQTCIHYLIINILKYGISVFESKIISLESTCNYLLVSATH